jgi:hypothetical protein
MEDTPEVSVFVYEQNGTPTGITSLEIIDSTAAGRELLTAANATEQRADLGLGSAALSSASDFAATSHTHVIANVTGLQTALDSKSNLAGGNTFTGTQDVQGFARFGQYGGTFQGVTFANNNNSAAADTVSFIDAQNNLLIADANIFFRHLTTGASSIELATTPAGSRTVDRRVPRMTITGDGACLFGTTSEFVWNGSNGSGAGIFQDGFGTFVRTNNPAMNVRRLSSDGTAMIFGRNATDVGNISVTTTATAYNTASDYRLKENLTPVAGALARINSLPVWRFNFIGDDKIVDGFMAHEAQAVVPESVTGQKDEVDGEGDPVYQGIDQAKLVPLLFAAVQELSAQVTALTARVAALEAAP